MQNVPCHSVVRQYFDVEFIGSEAAALALQGRLSACARSLLPVLERALDRHGPAHGVLRIDRLDIDAGSVSLERIEQDLPALLERCLDGALRAQLGDGGGANGGQALARHAGSLEVMEEALAYFLQYGTLPAALHLPAGMDFESAVLAAWRADGSLADIEGAAHALVMAPCAPALVAALRSASAFTRLLGQFSPAFQRALVARLSPALAVVLEQGLGQLRADAHGAGEAEALLRRSALELAVHGAAPGVRQPVHEALSNALPEQAARAARAGALAGAAGRALREARLHEVQGERELPNHPAAQQGIYIENAGLVLLHPFLPRLFEGLGVCGDARVLQPGRALALLHFLASGQPMAPEYALALPKVLCQLPLTANVDAGSALNEADREEAQALLAAVIGHWTALRDTSPDGLRGAFLLRPGKLSLRGGEWLLQVETQAADILLGELPWGFSAIRLPWMERILWVEWT